MLTVHEAYKCERRHDIYAGCNERNYRRYNDGGVFKIASRKERVKNLRLFEFLPERIGARPFNGGSEMRLSLHLILSYVQPGTKREGRVSRARNRLRSRESSFMAIVC